MPQRRSRRPEVEALTGQRRVPVLVIEGDAICDSYIRICFAQDAKRVETGLQRLGEAVAGL